LKKSAGKIPVLRSRARFPVAANINIIYINAAATL
jgi:hypothetical protein